MFQLYRRLRELKVENKNEMGVDLKNFIHVELTENEDGTHNVLCGAEWTDDHHFLDMLYKILDKWMYLAHSQSPPMDYRDPIEKAV